MPAEPTNSLAQLLDFLDQLEEGGIYFRLERNRSEIIMVRADVPGERWEIEFFVDGTIEVETFHSTEDGVIGDKQAQAALHRLIARFRD